MLVNKYESIKKGTILKLNNLIQSAGSVMNTNTEYGKGNRIKSVTVSFRIGDESFSHTVNDELSKSAAKNQCCEILLDKYCDKLTKIAEQRIFDKTIRYTTQAMIDMAAKEWPEAFNQRNPLPLCKGVHNEVRDTLGLTTAESKKLFKHWCNRFAYIENAIKTKVRIDLHGSKIETLTSREIEYAAHRKSRFKFGKSQLNEYQRDY